MTDYLSGVKLRLLITEGHDYMSFFTKDYLLTTYADGKEAMLGLWVNIEDLRTHGVVVAVNYLEIFDNTDRKLAQEIMTVTARVRKIATGEIFDAAQKSFLKDAPVKTYTELITYAKGRIDSILDPLLYVHDITKIELQSNPEYIPA